MKNEKFKVGFCSLGCPKNRVDGEELLGRLSGAGLTITPEAGEADVLVVHTCAFIGPAKEEAVATILEMAKYKESGRCRGLVVTGCLAERYGRELAAELPEVDAVLGADSKASLLGVVAKLLDLEIGEADTTARMLTTPKHSAYLKLAEGCDLNCSFCAIPNFKGPYRSRPLEQVMREAEDLVGQGVRELVLVAQNTTAYGRDLVPVTGLAALLRRLAMVPGLTWIRAMYAHPGQVNEELIRVMAEEEKVCPYLDLPLQHGSPRILRAMRRPDRPEETLRLVEKLRQRVPRLALRSSFIVGFPGETESDFRELVVYMRELELDRVGIFTYSQEEGTPAADLPDQVPEAVKLERQAILAAESASLSRRRLEGRIGERLSVVVEGRRFGRMAGRTILDAPEVDGRIYLKGKVVPTGTFAVAQITGCSEYDLFGKLVTG